MSDRASVDPLAIIRSRDYLGLLSLSALLGIPISVLAYFFLKATDVVQEWAFMDLPDALGYDSMPRWWPIIPLTLAGLAVGVIVTRMPGKGGETPIDGFGHSGETRATSIPELPWQLWRVLGSVRLLGRRGP